MTMCDYVVLCMTIYDYVWLCMTMYTIFDYVWLWKRKLRERERERKKDRKREGFGEHRKLAKSIQKNRRIDNLSNERTLKLVI